MSGADRDTRILFALAQGFISASIYFALGFVVTAALGFSWLVYLAAFVFFVLLLLSYMEGTSLYSERGGATMIARHGFNELVSFVAASAVLLDYLILIALCAFATTDYASVFWEPLGRGVPELILAIALILAVAWINIRGVGSNLWQRVTVVIFADIALQVVVVGFGLALLFEPDLLTDPAEISRAPSIDGIVFAFTIAIAAFSGLDASSSLAGQVLMTRQGMQRLLRLRAVALVPLVGLVLVASSVLPPAGERWRDAPLLGVVSAFEQPLLREPLRYLTALGALGVLIFACNSAMYGLARLGHSLALNRQIPSLLGRLHPRFGTPFVLISIGALLAIALVLPTDQEGLAAIYAFGATLAFLLVHLSVIRLRYTQPDRSRPYKLPFNVTIAGGELPLTAVTGALLAAVAFVSVIVFHDWAWLAGAGWVVGGVVFYVLYRLIEGKPILRRVTVPAAALIGRRESVEFASILVPVLGTPLDDDIMQTAGRLAAEDGEEVRDSGGTVIEAVWVFEIPVALSIDARIPEGKLKTARAALARAKSVGEEYQGITVATATVRARRAGEGIVREAKRRGVEAIVLAAEERSTVRSGPTFGGKGGLTESFIGETTSYVLAKARCRVILTAPAASDSCEDNASVEEAGRERRVDAAAP